MSASLNTQPRWGRGGHPWMVSVTSHSFPPFPKEVPRLDSVRPPEKHYSVVLPTVSHSGFLYKTASAGKLLQDRRAREGGCRARARPGHGILAWWLGQRSQSWPGWGIYEGTKCTLGVVSGTQLALNKWADRGGSRAWHCRASHCQSFL